MGLFDRLGQKGPQGTPHGQPQGRPVTPQEMRAEMGRIQQNPASYLKQRGFNIPAGMSDPKQITQHLLQTGQVGNPRLQMVMRMLGR